jgi:UrcA family protein
MVAQHRCSRCKSKLEYPGFTPADDQIKSMEKAMKPMLTLAAALLAASFAVPALAQENPSAISLNVRHADLDLTTEAGVRALDRRIANAAATACGIPSSADPDGKRAVKQCREEARERAYSQRQIAIAIARGTEAGDLASR